MIQKKRLKMKKKSGLLFPRGRFTAMDLCGMDKCRHVLRLEYPRQLKILSQLMTFEETKKRVKN